jgi:uncharacterized protein
LSLLLAFARAIAVACVGSVICVWLGTPLPWLIGSLVAVAAVNMLHGRLAAPVAAREAGQWAIGVTLGLYFAPDVVRETLRLGPWIAASVVFAIALGWLGALLLARLAATDAPTSYFAMAIGGASEMATQGERHGAQVDRVAAAHSLRIMLVVLIVPLLFDALGVRGHDPYVPLAREFDWLGFAVLIAVTAGAALVMERVNAPNAWMIGPLTAAALITATGHTFSSLPVLVINGGQLLIGISLGVRFTPEFFRAAPRYLAAVALITLVYLAASAAFGALISLGTGLHWSTALVATTPGGIGEMSLTARALALGVPTVTAFHAIRMIGVVLTVGVFYRTIQRWRSRSRRP